MLRDSRSGEGITDQEGHRSPPGIRRGEGGQMLVLFVLAAGLLFGMAALTIDVGLAYVERRSLQNAVDAAALAAAQDFANGESAATAVASAIDYLERHGVGNAQDVVEVSIPPVTGPFTGQSGYVEVTASSEAPTAFLGLFRDEPYTLNARSVAEGKPGNVGFDSEFGGGSPPPVRVPTVACGSPTVDGRVTAGDGYTKIGELVGASNDYGEVYFACDSTSYYFGMGLNGPSTGGGVANENVYGPRAKKNDPRLQRGLQHGLGQARLQGPAQERPRPLPAGLR